MRLPVWLVSTSLILFSICSNGQNETEPNQGPAGNSVRVFGANLHYVDAGSGSVVVLLHGLADDVGVWESVMPALAAKHRVIALDQIGFGRSDKPLLGYQAGTFVDFLDESFLTSSKLITHHWSGIHSVAGLRLISPWRTRNESTGLSCATQQVTRPCQKRWIRAL